MTPALFTNVVGASGVFPLLLDTCALFGPVLRDVLLEAAFDGMYRPHWSHEILAELERNLRAKGKSDAYINRLGQELRNAFPDAIISFPSGLELGLTCDRKDRHVLAAAITGQCSQSASIFTAQAGRGERWGSSLPLLMVKTGMNG